MNGFLTFIFYEFAIIIIIAFVALVCAALFCLVEWLSNRRIKCKHCKYGIPKDGKIDCMHFAQWDYYDDCPGDWIVEPDDWCKWAEKSKR